MPLSPIPPVCLSGWDSFHRLEPNCDPHAVPTHVRIDRDQGRFITGRV
jgi:hypothetical protein